MKQEKSCFYINYSLWRHKEFTHAKDIRPQCRREYTETERAYYDECGQHYNQGKLHVDTQSPANVGRLYRYYNMRLRNLLYRQFNEAVNLRDPHMQSNMEDILPPATHSHLNGIRHLMFQDVISMARSFLPSMPTGHDPFSPSHYEIESRQIDVEFKA